MGDALISRYFTDMNSYDRYLAMVQGEPVDFLPRTPILMQFAAEYIGSDYGALASDYRILCRANVACAIDFGIDQLSCISDPYRETQGFGSLIEYVPDGPPQSTHPLAENRDLAGLANPDPHTSERMRDRLQAAAWYRQHYGGCYSILGWVEGPAAEASALRGVTNFLLDVMDDEVYAGELMDRCLQVAIEFARAQVAAGVDTVGIGDAIASQIGPDLYESLIQPREKRLVQAIQQMGALAKLHICGNITHLLPGIADLGVDILDVDHLVDLGRVRAMVGNRTVLTGNLDPVSMMRHGTPAAIRRKMAEAYAQAGRPYFVNAGCEIPSGTPLENLRALCQPLWEA